MEIDPLSTLQDSLQTCLALTHSLETQDQAKDQFSQWRDRWWGAETATDPATTQAALDLLWEELVRARRSALICQYKLEMERGMTDRMAESHIQLQQNYLRLMQEQ
jgi:hypothetical protein